MSLLDDIAARVRSGRHLIDMDRGGTPDRYPPVSAAEIVAAEARLGFELPALLRDIYMQVGNGGFGPGYGLIGLDGGAPIYAGGRAYSLVDLYWAFRNRFSPLGEPWAERLLPICTWGCSYFCYLDCALPTAPVMAIDEDSHGHGPWGCAFSLHAHSFEEWMRRWLDGENLWECIGLEGEPIVWFRDIQPLLA
jgi:hypothetical protein